MAYKDSGEIATNSNYALGDYSFRIERSSGTSPDYDKLEAVCTKNGKNARKSIQVPSTYQYSGYYVEANGTTADVYAVVGVPKGEGSEIISSAINQPLERVAATAGLQVFKESGPVISTNGVVYAVAWKGSDDNPQSSSWGSWSFCSGTSGAYVVKKYDYYDQNETVRLINSYAYQGKTVYYTSNGFYQNAHGGINIPFGAKQNLSVKEVCWHVIYGEIEPPEYETKQMLVGRFAIDLEDAGGVGPGSDWVDPGDYDEDWEPEEPTHTLYVEVTGALSGRHNDPIEDPSYSYIPADKDTVKDYGCGGDGGHGGGGGAGASTVVIHKFATNQANSKEVIAIARRHGYGSGGGKGGKGGDGCILVYY